VTLLTEIQSAATDSAHSTADLLRKCQILAFRLRHEPFNQWVAHELNGYPDAATLPSYRGPFEADLKATTQGAGRRVRNVDVSDWSVPKKAVRDQGNEMTFHQGVGTLERLVDEARRGDQRVVASEFSTVLAVGTQAVGNERTVRLWKELPVTLVEGILDQVRSKALEFVLEIEAVNAEAGSTATSEPPVPLAQMDIIFNTVMLGGQNAPRRTGADR
jgi:hypothetical protein